MENQNKEITIKENQAIATLGQAQQLLYSFSKNYCALFPKENFDDIKRLALTFADKLMQVKDKANRPAIEFCTPQSIQEAFFKTLRDKLDLDRGQASLIPYGNVLTVQSQYFGNVMLAKTRIANLVDIRGVVIYKGDKIKVSVDKGCVRVVGHETSFENMCSGNIAGAYADAIFRDSNGEEYVRNSEIMNVEEINQAWKQSRTMGANSVHQKFSHEMARKTVESRCAKHLLNKEPSVSQDLIYDDENPREENAEVFNVNDTPTMDFTQPQNTPIMEDMPMEKESQSNYFVNEAMPNLEPEMTPSGATIMDEPQPIMEEVKPIIDVKTMADLFNKGVTPSYATASYSPNQSTNENFQSSVGNNQQNNINDVASGTQIEVAYREWKDIYQPTGQWKSGKYNPTTKAIVIEKI